MGGVTEVEPSTELIQLRNREDELNSAKVSEQIADAALAAAGGRQEHEHALEAKRQVQDLKLQKEREDASGIIQDQSIKRQVAYLRELHGLDVDLTRYLVAQSNRSDNEVCELAQITMQEQKPGGMFCCAPDASKNVASKRTRQPKL